MKFIIELDLEHPNHGTAYDCFLAINTMLQSCIDAGMQPDTDLKAVMGAQTEEFMMLAEATSPDVEPDGNCHSRVMLSKSNFIRKFHTAEQAKKNGNEMLTVERNYKNLNGVRAEQENEHEAGR